MGNGNPPRIYQEGVEAALDLSRLHCISVMYYVRGEGDSPSEFSAYDWHSTIQL